MTSIKLGPRLSLDPVPPGYHLRIEPTSFIAFIISFHIIAFISAIIRTYFCLRVHGRLFIDDYLLLFSLACITAAAGVAYSIKDLVYLQIYIGLGWQAPSSDFWSRMLDFEKQVQICSALIWTAIYAVKFSFLTFFRKLVRNVHLLDPWWWVVFCILIVGGLVSLPLAFIVCSNFSEDYMQYCPVQHQLHNERIYLDTTTVFDVITDLLIISIPIALLWKVQINLQRKLVLGGMLSLSAFMVVIAIIRTALAPLPNSIIDTSWLFFWVGIEAACAVIMVSLTSFRALFGQQKKITQRRKGRMSDRSGESRAIDNSTGEGELNQADSFGANDGGRQPLLAVPLAAMTKV